MTPKEAVEELSRTILSGVPIETAPATTIIQRCVNDALEELACIFDSRGVPDTDHLREYADEGGPGMADAEFSRADAFETAAEIVREMKGKDNG